VYRQVNRDEVVDELAREYIIEKIRTNVSDFFLRRSVLQLRSRKKNRK